MEQFNQILELDGDGDYDFSASMVGAFFDQASSTFDEMKDALYVLAVPLPYFDLIHHPIHTGRRRTSPDSQNSAISLKAHPPSLVSP